MRSVQVTMVLLLASVLELAHIVRRITKVLFEVSMIVVRRFFGFIVHLNIITLVFVVNFRGSFWLLGRKFLSLNPEEEFL